MCARLDCGFEGQSIELVIPAGEEIFLFTTTSTLVVGPIRLSSKWELDMVFLIVQRLGFGV
jgi:hypothetical protein